MGGDSGTGGAEWVTEGDGATADVGLVVVQAELLLDGQELGSEGLIDLAQVHLVQAQAGGGKGLVDGGDRANTLIQVKF